MHDLISRRRAFAVGAGGLLGMAGVGCDEKGRPHPALGPAVSIARLFIKLPWLRYLDIGLTVFEVLDKVLQVTSHVNGTRRDEYQQRVTTDEVDYLKGGGKIGVEWRDGVKSETTLGRHSSFAVTVWDRLGPGQLQDDVTITAGGVTQSLLVTRDRPAGRMVFMAPFAGEYPGTLVARTWFENGEIRDGVGQGYMTVSGPGTFELTVLNANVEPMELTLRRL
jgi:hypothetical protein